MGHGIEVHNFWERAKKAKGIKGDFVDAWGFGDSPQLKDELLALVLEGKKTGTASLVKENELEGWPINKVGDFNVILDGRDRPRAVIQTLSVRQCRFDEVDAEHAFSEGEDDRSLASFLREHRKYWRRSGERLGYTFSDDMDVILERFRLVYAEL
jgi:histidinol-phosphate aminotransferase